MPTPALARFVARPPARTSSVLFFSPLIFFLSFRTSLPKFGSISFTRVGRVFLEGVQTLALRGARRLPGPHGPAARERTATLTSSFFSSRRLSSPPYPFFFLLDKDKAEHLVRRECFSYGSRAFRLGGPILTRRSGFLPSFTSPRNDGLVWGWVRKRPCARPI